MNEEIQFSMGLDTSPFAAGVRQTKRHFEDLKNNAKGAGTAIGDYLKGGIAGIVTGAALYSLIDAGKHILEYAQKIQDSSETLGVSAKYFQQFNYTAERAGANAETAEKGFSKLAQKIGEARSGNEQASDSFAKLGISLDDSNGNALTTEDVMERVRKKINAIEDPAQRVAAAMDLFGKSGAKLVNTLKEFDTLSAKSDGKIISDSDLEKLDDAQKKIETMGGQLKVFGAHQLANLSRLFGFSTEQDALRHASENFDKANAKSQAPDITQTRAYIDAIRGLQDAQAERGGVDAQTKYISALRQRDRIQKDMQRDGIKEIDKIKLQTELQKAENKILEERKNLNNAALETAKKHREEDAKRKEMQIEMNHLKQSETDAESALQQEKQKGTRLTLAELATSQFRFGGTLGQDQNIARQIQTLEQQREWNRQHGRYDDADARQGSIDQLRKQLSSNVPESDRDPYKRLEEHAKDTADAVTELLAKAKAEGININPTNG